MIAELAADVHLGDRALQQNRGASQPHSNDGHDDDYVGQRGTALIPPESIQEASGDGHEFSLPYGTYSRLLLFFLPIRLLR